MTTAPAPRAALLLPADRIAVIFLIFMTAFRFWYIGLHELVQDEAYYWQWSRHLDLGYYDNTPLMAYVIHACTTIFGTNEVGVRAGAVLSALIASIFVYLLAKRTLGERVALIAVVLANIVPLFAAGALLMTQDPVQLALWPATLYIVWLAIGTRTLPRLPQREEPEPGETSPNPSFRKEGDQHQAPPVAGGGGGSVAGWAWRLWLLAGVLAGLTTMAKLNGILVLAGVLLFLALSPTYRFWLKRPEPYVAAVIALLIFAPFVWWNHTHLNAFWTHIHAMGTRGADKAKTLRWTGEFLGAQALLISPLIFLTYLATLKLPKAQTERERDALLFLWCPSVVVFTATILQTFRGRVEGNWAVAAYITGLILVAYLMANSIQAIRARVWFGLGSALACLLSLVILFPGILYAFGLTIKGDKTNELYGWRRMAARVATEQNALGGPSRCFVFGLNYRMPSELAFYLPDHPTTYSLFLHDRANEYLFWEDPKTLIGKNAVCVNDADTPDHLDDCRAVFQRVEVEPPLAVHRAPYKKPIRTIQIFRCYGFKGYDRKTWQQGW